MGGAARPLHDAGNNRSVGRGSNLQATRRGSLTTPAKPAGERENANALTPPPGTRSRASATHFGNAAGDAGYGSGQLWRNGGCSRDLHRCGPKRSVAADGHTATGMCEVVFRFARDAGGNRIRTCMGLFLSSSLFLVF